MEVLPFREEIPERTRGRLAGQAAGPSSAHADVAGDRRQCHARTHHLLAVGAALHGITLVEHGRLARGVLAREALDRIARDRGDRLRPLRCFGYAVARTEHVILVRLGVGDLGRHLIGVESGTAPMDEIGVMQIARDDDVCHGRHQCGVGTGPKRYPLVRQAGGARGMTRIETDDSGTTAAGLQEKVVVVGAVASFGGVPSPHENELAVEPVLPLVPTFRRSDRDRCHDVGGPPAVAVVVAQVTTEAVEEASRRLSAGELRVATGSVRHEQGAVAVRVAHAGELGGHLGERFVPAHGSERSGATWPGASERRR